MVPQVIVPNALEALPARPPTPPREKSVNPDLSSRKKHIFGSQSLHTPPSFSPESSDLSNPTSRRNRKKVGFTSQPEYCEAPAYANNAKLQHPTPVSTTSTASAPSSGRPIKSILKPSAPVVNPLDPSVGLDGISRPVDIIKMLESTVQQLAGADRDLKVDAYMMIVRVLKNSNSLPDRIALQDKMGLFMQFIQRDITAKTSEGSLDSSLVNHALMLLSTFMFYPAIASTLSNDFGVFIIDHCIRSFEDASAPKDVTRHLMQVVAYQDFSPKVMTADRVGRLVASLHTIEDRVQGKSIIQSRLFIYRRLIKQSKMHMISHSDWLLDLFEDMLSSVREIRAAAIALGLEASFTIAKEKQFSRRVMEILQMSVDETKYIELYVGRLRAMLKEKYDSTAVPQIWSVVILLMRCPVDRWEFFGPWLEIIQSCFNSSDFQTKLEANYAWNRLVYALQLNDQSFAKTIATICQPFLSQLKRRSTGKQSAELRKVVFGSICNLYYYAFKPNTSTAHLDAFWDACVRPLFQRMIVPEAEVKSTEKTVGLPHDHTAQATIILTGLLDSTTPRIWKEDHVWADPLVKPEDLPALDAKWVRHNASRVFGVVEQILIRTYFELAKPESATAKLWRAIVGAVAAAASKEVKVSTDTATFVAHSFTFLLKMWSRGIEKTEDMESKSTTFFEATSFFIGTMIDALGLLPFTERQLSMGNQNTFVPVSTPSHRPAKGQGQTRTPLHHLFSVLSMLPPNTVDGQDLATLIQRVLAPFLSAMSNKSSRGRADLAQELMQLIPMDTLIPYGPWLAISDTLSNCLDNSQMSHSSTSSSGQAPIGHEYREIVKHLERGIRSTPNLPWEHWKSLFQALFVRVAAEAGEAGCAIAIVEPVAKCAMDIVSARHDTALNPTLLNVGSELVSNAKHPRDRQALEAARRRLWGTSAGGSRSTSHDPFDNLYKLANHLLEATYKQYNDTISVSICSLLEDISGFLLRCNQELSMKALVIIQNGIGAWIRDTDELYNSRQSTALSEAVKQLWSRVCTIFAQADSLEELQLDTIEPLLCSAFESKHKHIVSTATIMWNGAVEQSDSIQYPDKLRAVLLSLRPYVDIALPGLDDLINESSGQPPSFIDSQEDDSAALNQRPRSSRNGTPQMKKPTSRRSTPGSVQLSLPAKRHLDSTPEVSRLRSTRKSTTPRLRHNDSQIQFAAIASSSPTHNNAESQVLTDRQREVRDRQRDNSALFPEIKSSVEQRRSTRLSVANSTTSTTTPERNLTPKSHRRMEDYVSLTPTPRRGQAIIIDNDQEMTDDMPSSPPEPRRYPLLPELTKPQSSSSIILEDWPPSSPISDSPSRNRQSAPKHSESVVPAPPEPSNEASAEPEVMEPPVVDGDVEMDESEDYESEDADVEDETNIPVAEQDLSKVASSLPAAVKTVATEDPATPSHPRFQKDQETPRSDNEVYVDALSSPKNSPRNQRSQGRTKQQAVKAKAASQPAADYSFDASDVDERSMLRLVVELDSRKCNSLPKDGAELLKKAGEPQSSPPRECITVNTVAGQTRRRSARNKGRSEETEPVIASTPVEPDSSQASIDKPQNKRKRAQESSQEGSQESGSKKRKHREDVDSDNEAVPDSQLLPANDSTLLEPSETSGREPPSSSSRESSDHDSNDEMEAEEAEEAPSPSADDSEAIHLQIVQEASQSEVAEDTVDDSFDFTDDHETQAALADLADVAMTEDVEQEDESEEPEDEQEDEEEGEEEDEDLMDDDDEEEIPATEEAAVAAEESSIMMSSDELPLESVLAMPPPPPPEKSSMEKIVSALRGGLAELSTAALSRDEVNRIEDMFYDIKRELYNAESRGRALNSQPR
ncbi:Telomere length regulator protein [Apiospora sp. TS-2023a]